MPAKTKVTFEMTTETACEALARMGAKGSLDEIEMIKSDSRTSYRLPSNGTEAFIAAMWESGYRVIRATVWTPSQASE